MYAMSGPPRTIVQRSSASFQDVAGKETKYLLPPTPGTTGSVRGLQTVAPDVQRAPNPAEPMSHEDPDLVFSATLQWFLKNAPFFGTLMQHVVPVWDDKVERAATDGKRIYLQKDWFVSQTPQERRGALLHETLHCALQHIPRRGNREHDLWNRAGDIVINGIIDDYFKGTKDLKSILVLPQNVVRRDDLKHLSSEEIYEILLQEREDLKNQGYNGDQDHDHDDHDKEEGDEEGEGQGQGEGDEGEGDEGEGEGQGQGKPGKPGKPGKGKPGQGPGQPGQGPSKPGKPGKQSEGPDGKKYKIPPNADPDQFWGSHSAGAGHDCTKEGAGKDMSPEEAAKQIGQWNGAMNRAIAEAQRTNTFGNFSAGALRQIGFVLEPPTVDWISALSNMLTKDMSDFTGPFDRRMIYQGYYVETLETENVKLFLCLDTSGSLTEDLLNSIISEVVGILSIFPNVDGEGYYCDAELFGPYPITDMPKREPQGGGGTSFDPFFEKIKNEDEGVAIYFTDGYAPKPQTEPKIPVLWVVTPGGAPDEAFPDWANSRIIRMNPSQDFSKSPV